ncbi:MAG: glycosyltransferase family 2 protein [Anaerolineae bacterium]
MAAVSIVIPAYNEEEAIGSVIDQVISVMEKADILNEIIVVDDGSTDETVQIVQEKAVQLVRHPFNKGYGAALKTGMRKAKYDTIAIIDADGTYPVEDLPRLVSGIGEWDMVVGARVGEHAQIPPLRKLARWFLTQLANYLVGTPIPDLNSGLRAFRKDIVMRFYDILPSGFSFTVTITLALLSNDYLVQYIPICYYKRRGKSKIKPIRDTLGFLQLTIRTVMYFAPLKIFLPMSLALFLFGVVILLYSVLVLHKLMDVTVVVTMLASMQIAAIGLLADLMDKRSPKF